MTGEYISINGRLLPVSSCGRQLKRLLDTNYTYRDILTTGHRPVHLETQLELLALSCRALYGPEPGLEPTAVSKHTGELLYRNNAAQGGNVVRIVAAPDGTAGAVDTFIFYEGPTMYSGYSLWHRQLKVIPLTCGIPFPLFRTSASLACHNYAQQYALRQGYDGAVTVDYTGTAVSFGQHPLFCIHGQDVYTADAENTAPQSVERLLGIELCSLAGYVVHEKAVHAPELSAMDELFSFSTTGIIPLAPAGDKLLTSSAVKTMERHLGGLAGYRPEL